MELESLHSVPISAIDKIFETIHQDQLHAYSVHNVNDSIKRSAPNMSILLNDKKRNEVIAEKFFDGHPHETTYAGEKLYYLPLSDQLRSLFKSKRNVDWIDSSVSRQSTNGEYKDLCDGSIIKNSNFFNTYRDALQFIIYMDECFLKDRTEYMMVYCTIGNFPTFVRCQLHNLLPLAAIPTRIIQRCGDGALIPVLHQFVPFATPSGVDIKIYNSAYRTFRGEVVVGLFDHKAAHELGGFYSSFNNMKRFCRHCLIHRSDIRSTDRTLFVKRTPEHHDCIVEAIENGISEKGIRSMFGVKGFSVLHELPNFHVCQKLPPDLMHTEFEGELKRELCLFIDFAFNTGNWFSHTDINRLIRHWRNELDLKKLVPDGISDKFCKNVSSNELTSSQIYSLSSLMPYLCTELPCWDEICDSVHYKSLIKHLEYLEVALQWTFTENDLEKLDRLLDEHVALWIEAYPNTFCPKAHYRFHFTEAIRSFGPLVGIYCMRYEAKHQVMKRLVKNSNNHNDAKCILIKVLKHLASEDHESEVNVKDPTTILPRTIQSLLADCQRSCNTKVTAYKVVTYRSMTYRIGDLVATATGYGRVQMVYQFDDETIYILVRHCVQADALPHLPYNVITEGTMSTYIPFTDIRGKLHTLSIKGQSKSIIIHISSAIFVE